MDLKDMILVTENDRGTETNMLMTLDDYKSFIAVRAGQKSCISR